MASPLPTSLGDVGERHEAEAADQVPHDGNPPSPSLSRRYQPPPPPSGRQAGGGTSRRRVRTDRQPKRNPTRYATTILDNTPSTAWRRKDRSVTSAPPTTAFAKAAMKPCPRCPLPLSQRPLGPRREHPVDKDKPSIEPPTRLSNSTTLHNRRSFRSTRGPTPVERRRHWIEEVLREQLDRLTTRNTTPIPNPSAAATRAPPPAPTWPRSGRGPPPEQRCRTRP